MKRNEAGRSARASRTLGAREEQLRGRKGGDLGEQLREGKGSERGLSFPEGVRRSGERGEGAQREGGARGCYGGAILDPSLGLGLQLARALARPHLVR